MKRLYVQHLILSSTLIFALGACGHKPTKTMKQDMPFAVSSPPPQQVVLLQEARGEADNLRAELARLKILMAKQAGELYALRVQSQSVHHREQDQGQELQEIRSQLLSTQAERDQLQKQNIELESQVSGIPDTSQLVSDIRSLHSSFQQIMSSMKGLAADMRLIKQEMHITTNTLKPQQTKTSKGLPSSVNKANKLTPDSNGRIVIQEGDTLWKLSRTYQVSIEELRDWNSISSDLIMTGLRLQVAKPMKTVKSQHTLPKIKAELPVSKTNTENLNMSVQNTPQHMEGTSEGNPSEPTHILSIGNPESEFHESP